MNIENEIPEGLNEISQKAANSLEYLRLVEKYEATLDEDGNEPDYDFEDEEEGDIYGYECNACGNVQSTSFSCDECISFCLDPLYE